MGGTACRQRLWQCQPRRACAFPPPHSPSAAARAAGVARAAWCCRCTYASLGCTRAGPSRAGGGCRSPLPPRTRCRAAARSRWPSAVVGQRCHKLRRHCVVLGPPTTATLQRGGVEMVGTLAAAARPASLARCVCCPSCSSRVACPPTLVPRSRLPASAAPACCCRPPLGSARAHPPLATAAALAPSSPLVRGRHARATASTGAGTDIHRGRCHGIQGGAQPARHFRE